MSNALTPNIQAQLEALHDIQLPEPLSWWPLAPGWWILITVIFLAIVTIITYIVVRRRRLSQMALLELKNLRNSLTDEDILETATKISILLHRIALHKVPRIEDSDVEKINADAWLKYLCQGEHGMTQDIAEFLTKAPYMDSAKDDPFKAAQIFDASELWIRRNA